MTHEQHPLRTQGVFTNPKKSYLLPVWKILRVFIDCKFTRRLVGGQWELWYVDHPMCSTIWHSVDRSRGDRERPTGLCRGTVASIENYPNKV